MKNIRWIQRFENFKEANKNLADTIACIKENGINKIYTMAIIQAFEMSFELGWKTMKDYLEYNGTQTQTPRQTIKDAFSSELILKGQEWIDMMEARNKTSHTYKEDYAKETAENILNIYYPLLMDLEKTLKAKTDE